MPTFGMGSGAAAQVNRQNGDRAMASFMLRDPLYLTARTIVIDDPARGAQFAHDRRTGRQWRLNEEALGILHQASTPDGYRWPTPLTHRAAVKAMRTAGLLAPGSQSCGAYHRPTTGLSRVFAEITAQCNLRCEHCYGQFSIDRREKLSVADVDALAGRAAAIGVYEFDVTGGEPLLHPQFAELLGVLDDHRMLTTVFTNLTHVPERARAALTERHVTKVITSIESLDPQIHDSFRGLPGAHRRTLKHARALQETGTRVVVNVVAGQHNLATVPDTVRFLADQGMSVAVDMISECGRAVRGSGVTASQAAALRSSLRRLSCYREQPSEGCGVGSRLLYVTSTGDLTLCPSLRSDAFRVGSVHEPYDLGRVAERVSAFAPMRCTTACPVADLCAGGCRAEALRLRGSLGAPDPSRCEFYGVA